MMKHTLTILTAVLLAPPGATQAADNPRSMPNIILILADDLGYGDLGCQRDLFWRTMSHRAVRSGPWKLVAMRQKGTSPELYNLDDDPGEEHNVAKNKPAIVKTLLTAWARWEAETSLSARKYSR